MTINGVPLHPLVVHAAVVFVPLAVLAVLTLLVPRWRWASRWVALVVVALAAGSVQLAAMTGDDLTLVAFWVLPHTTALRSGRDKDARIPVLVLPVTALLPVLAVAVLILVFLTGDAGARAVWKG